MRCVKCHTEFNGNFCPNCGTRAVQTNKEQGILFGFRSNKGWKKFLSTVYLIFCSLMLLSICTDGREGQITTYDFLIDKTVDLIMMLSFLSPYIFLSNTKLRNVLPLFNKRKAILSFIGLFAISFVLGLSTGAINSMHSEEYQADMENHAYVVVSTEGATCTTEGVASMKCDYCGKTTVETIPASGHNFTEEILQAATCSETGLIINSCAVCNATEETKLDMLGHTYQYVTTKTPTLEENGIETGTCTTCGEVHEKEIPQLGTKTNPAEVTVNELVNEINANIDVAKSKYNGKWLKITGKVLDTGHVAGMTKFYLHGEYGGSGLKIICWVNEEVLKPFDFEGETHTFIGQVREITTVNATEIGDCTIVTD